MIKKNKIPEISIIIVYYDKLNSFIRTLRSIYDSRSKVIFEVIVVDNSKSGDVKSPISRSFRWVRYIKAPKNLGYGGGNNLGARYAKGEYLFILNPDTEVKDYALDNLAAFLEKNKSAAIVAPNLIHEDGRAFDLIGSRTLTPMRGIIALSFLNKIFPNNPISREYFLKEIPKNRLRKVDVVPGTAFMIRKEVFNKVHGFDENFFLYFEESDLCKRVEDVGGKIYIIPDAVVIHYHIPVKRSKKLNKINQISRYYYFKKHYGVLSALIVESFARFSKWDALFIIVLTVATILRFWKLGTFINFGGDVAWYFLSARNMVLTGRIPLVGIPSSVPILRQGAIWTWILAGVLKLCDFNPIASGILAAVFGITSIVGTYFLVSSWFGKRAGLIASIISSASLYLILHDRMPYHTTPIYLVTIFFAWSVTEALEGKKIQYVMIGFWLAVLFQLELASYILFILVAILFLIERTKIKIGNVWFTILGGIIGLLPFIIYDVKVGVYLQTFGFLGWFFTKVAEGLSGIVSSGTGYVELFEVKKYITQFVFAKSTVISFLLFVLSIVYFIYYLKMKYKKLKVTEKFIFLWFFITLTGFSLKGTFSAMYLPLIFFPTIVILGLFFEWVVKKTGWVGYSVLLFYSLLNIFSIFIYFNDQLKTNQLTYSKRLEIADYILSSADNQDYEFIYSANGQKFATDDDPWQYILWWKGNEPKSKSENKIYIFQEPLEPFASMDKTRDFGEVNVGIINK